MRILLESIFEHPSAELTYDYLQGKLLAYGHSATRVSSISTSTASPDEYDLLISHGRVGQEWRDSMPCYGGNGWARPQILRLLEDHGLATMRWATVRSLESLHEPFDVWDVDRVLMKPSHTHGGDSVEVFRRGRAGTIAWNPHEDVFCAEVNPDSGDVYKVEVFNGVDTITWMSKSRPISDQLTGPYQKGLSGSYGDRLLVDAPSEIVERVRSCNRRRNRSWVYEF